MDSYDAHWREYKKRTSFTICSCRVLSADNRFRGRDKEVVSVRRTPFGIRKSLDNICANLRRPPKCLSMPSLRKAVLQYVVLPQCFCAAMRSLQTSDIQLQGGCHKRHAECTCPVTRLYTDVNVRFEPSEYMAKLWKLYRPVDSARLYQVLTRNRDRFGATLAQGVSPRPT